MIATCCVFDLKDRYKNKPLAIVAPGPSYDKVPFEAIFNLPTIFALNASIVTTYSHKDVFWVSNDHDRTFQNKGIREGLLPRIAGYSPWRTITSRKFIPGVTGDIDWRDHHGRMQPPMKWRLPAPDRSWIGWYDQTPGNKGYINNGETVLELALEVATIWGFSPIFLFGVDLTLVRPNRKEPMPSPCRAIHRPVYYAKEWHWKGTPPRVLRGKMNQARTSIKNRRNGWPQEIYLVNSFWKGSPFNEITHEQIPEIL